MNEEKYYTPDISDLRVGYECETKSIFLNQDWVKEVLDVDGVSRAYSDIEHSDIDEPFEEQYRTPFLTKEQIEKEGWVYKDGWYLKGDMRLYFWNIEPEYRTPRITIDSTLSDGLYFSFFGECKSINEFRFICKLLNIK